MYLLFVYVVFVYLNQIVPYPQGKFTSISEKMRTITFSNGLLWLSLLGVNAELTLESVYQKVNDLEVEMNVLKVGWIKLRSHAK